MSYLDDPRVYFAAERTMLAWQRTVITLMGLGFVIERFGLFVRMMVTDGKATAQTVAASFYLGVTLLIVAGVVALIASYQFHRFAASLTYPEIPRRWMVWFGPLLNVALGMISLAMAAWFIFTL
ncbi:DUF202 domain-containing protein [Cupriavidus necator]|uniref:YidH family protein n=1 Tax=Cupriavidus necator TaxID=106590 RepID=UPI0039C27353